MLSPARVSTSAAAAAAGVSPAPRSRPCAAQALRRPARTAPAQALPLGSHQQAGISCQQTVRQWRCPVPLQRPHQHQQQQQSRRASHVARITPFDQAWGTQIDGQSLASQLFAASLLPYLGFLFHLTRSGQAPRLTLGGFYFLLVFVGATIPAGIYAKTHFGTSLANVDWLHGGAESLLTITNLLIVLGLRQGIKEAETKKNQS